MFYFTKKRLVRSCYIKYGGLLLFFHRTPQAQITSIENHMWRVHESIKIASTYLLVYTCYLKNCYKKGIFLNLFTIFLFTLSLVQLFFGLKRVLYRLGRSPYLLKITPSGFTLWNGLFIPWKRTGPVPLPDKNACQHIRWSRAYLAKSDPTMSTLYYLPVPVYPVNERERALLASLAGGLFPGSFYDPVKRQICFVDADFQAGSLFLVGSLFNAYQKNQSLNQFMNKPGIVIDKKTRTATLLTFPPTYYLFFKGGILLLGMLYLGDLLFHTITRLFNSLRLLK